MQAYAPSHPQQGAIYYKIKDNESGKSVACIWDNESKIGGDKAVIKFIRGCDLVIHDTQYTTEEYENEKIIVQGFGHSTYEMAIDNAIQAGVKKLCCTHYNPAHTDEKLYSINLDLKKKLTLDKSLDIFMSKENVEIEL
jgi:ribonuclease BN (tRNA processing enzyme)